MSFDKGYAGSASQLMIECSEKIAQGIIGKEDYVNNVLLINLYSKGRGQDGGHPCFDVEDVFGLLAEKVNLPGHIKGLKDLGLVEEGLERNTVMYKLTPLGVLVAEKIDSHETESGYPAITQLLGDMKEMYASYPEISNQLDAISASIA